MSPSLYCVAGPYAGQEFPLDGTGIVIGRDPSAVNVVLESPQVSRAHLRVYAAGDGSVALEDLNSSNGTFLLKNGSPSRITGLVTLSNGDRFSVGSGANYVFEARCDTQAPAGEPRTVAAEPQTQRTASPPPPPPAGDQSPLFQKVGIQVNMPAYITEDMLAARTSRLLAMLIDGVTFLAIFIVLSPIVGIGAFLGMLGFIAGALVPLIGPLLQVGMGAVAFLPMALVYALYTLVNIYFLYKDGQTLGKKAMGIYIAGLDTKKASIINIVLLRMIAMEVLICLPFVGWIINIVNICFIARADRRMLHDMLAGTVVLRKNR